MMKQDELKKAAILLGFWSAAASYVVTLTSSWAQAVNIILAVAAYVGMWALRGIDAPGSDRAILRTMMSTVERRRQPRGIPLRQGNLTNRQR